jgi:hypothetical protein|tara:strand:- start:9263 stop:11662 length:2400 start_codon:yes stop_codon:yes gene_type:complete
VTPETEFAGTPQQQEARSSSAILGQLQKSKDEFRDWDDNCHLIDEVYSRAGGEYDALVTMYGGNAEWSDADLDLFWASFEILKPAVYARAPIPAVKPLFSDNDLVKNTTAEVLERASVSAFALTDINDVMYHVRDDLLFAGRGVIWMRYETDDGERVSIEHLDRKDFRHEPARKWSEVGWVAGGFWLTRDDIKKRFGRGSGVKNPLTDAEIDRLNYTLKRDEQHASHTGSDSLTQKVQVWEVWHRADNQVYWVTEGFDRVLDQREPMCKLSGFFPCPKPAYATLQRRSLIPVPDWDRYAVHFRKISDLTARIYLLLTQVKMMGLVGGGGEIEDAVQEMMRSNDDQILIKVNSLDVANAVSWLPLAEVAQAITGLIEARRVLIDDFYQLSGISDIMRGATEAEETLGAQRMKSQYGSVRVRCKIDELQRIAADAVKIAAEIIAEKFSEKTIFELSQITLPKRSEVEKRIKDIEAEAKRELEGLADQAEQMAQEARMQAEAAMAQGEQVDPQEVQAQLQQAQMQFQQQQQEVIQRYADMLQAEEQKVSSDAVMELLRDDRVRSFTFDIESDSTIMTDEAAEKQSRVEFMGAFTQASQALMGLATQGEQGAKLAGEMLKFVLAPYRAGRQLDTAIDDFVDAAQMMAGQQDEEGDAEGVAALAEAERMKAEAAMAKVTADSAAKQAENERKLMEMQQKAGQQEREFEAQIAKLQQDGQALTIKAEEALAKVDNLRADTMKKLAEAGVVPNEAALNEFKSLEEIDIKRSQEQRAAVKDMREAARADRNEVREATAPAEEGGPSQ